MASRAAVVFLLAALLCGSCAAEKGKYTEFTEWCVANGFKYISQPNHTIALIDPTEEETYANLGLDKEDLDELKANGGRGIFAVNDAEPGDVILVVPFNSTIFMTDDYPPPPWKGADDYARLASLLLLEYAKGETSRFWPFLRIIPEHVPLPWVELTPEEFDEMHYEPAKENAQYFYEESQMWFKNADKSVKAFSTFKQWAWANAVLNTRAFWLPVPEKNDPDEVVSRGMFLPFGDMFNHDEAFHTEWEQRVFNDRVELLAVRPLKKGKQVYDHYGKRTSTAFYLEMGWVATSNPHDDITLFLVPEAASEWYARALGLCRDEDDACFDELESGLLKSIEEAKKTHPSLIEEEEDEEVSEDLCLQSDYSANVRLTLTLDWLRGAALKKYHDRKDEPAVRELFDEWYLDSSVLHVHAVSVKRLHDLLAGYPTSAEEDEALLEAADKECEKGEDDEEAGQCTWKEPMKPALRQAIEFRLYIKRNMKWVAEQIQMQIDNADTTTDDLSDE